MHVDRARSGSRPSVVGLFLVATFAAAIVFGSSVHAQDLPEVPSPPTQTDLDNTTEDIGPAAAMQIQIETDRTYERVNENEIARYTVIARDASVEGTQFYRASVSVTCSLVNETQDARGWSSTQSVMPIIRHGQEVRAEYTIATGPRPTPEFYSVSYECRAGAPIDDIVGNFTLTAQAAEYTYMSFKSLGPVSQVRPDREVDFRVQVENKGSHVKRFIGSVTAPDGWTFPSPPVVVLKPGESRDITITGISPRDQIYYLSGADTIIISYHPDGEPGKARTAYFPVAVKGLYLHPALIPLTLLTVTLTAVLIFFGVLARRAVEERILGKPVPPWRIPVEREYLEQLMKDDPDQYYIVRHYLMVEEHQSALLWFEAFKKATKKDRKRESKWFKVKRKQERKVIRLEKGHNKLVAAWDKDLDKPERKAERKKRRLERKLRRKERKKQRKVNRKHKKRSKKLVKKYQKTVKKATKKFEKKRDKEVRKVEKANRKREKNGEEPLPLPDFEPPTFEEPEAGEPEVIPEVPLMESRYAKRAERIDARAERKKARRMAKKERTITKDRDRVDVKSERLRAKIPPEPETALYSDDDFIPEDEVIVEDDRSALAKWLFLPTLEERDRARRRRSVHRADLQKAQAAGNEGEVERLKSQYAEERKARTEARKERIKGNLAHRVEAKRLAAQRKRDLKARRRSTRGDKGPAAPDGRLVDETAPRTVRDRSPHAADEPIPPRRRFKVGKRKVPAKRNGAEDEAAAKSPEQGQT